MKFDPRSGTGKPGIAIMIGVKPSKKDDKKKYGGADGAQPHNVMKTGWDYRNVDGTPNMTGYRNPFNPGPHDISRPIISDWDWSERSAVNAREKRKEQPRHEPIHWLDDEPFDPRESMSAPSSNPTEAEKHGLTQEQYDDWEAKLNRLGEFAQFRHHIPDFSPNMTFSKEMKSVAFDKAWNLLKGNPEHQLFSVNPKHSTLAPRTRHLRNYADIENNSSAEDHWFNELEGRIGTAHPAIFGTRYGRKPFEYPTPLANMFAYYENRGINPKLKPELGIYPPSWTGASSRVQDVQSWGLPDAQTQSPPKDSIQHTIDTTPWEEKDDPNWMHNIDMQSVNNPLSDDMAPLSWDTKEKFGLNRFPEDYRKEVEWLKEKLQRR